MIAMLSRSTAAALLAGSVTLAVTFVLHGCDPGLSTDMTGPLPPMVEGIYPPERDPAGAPFAWTSGRVSVRLPDLDRRSAWTLTASARAARPDASQFPELAVAIDGAVVLRERLTNEPHAIEATIPGGPDLARGVEIVWTLTPTFVPGGGDTRELGAVVTRLAIEPRGMVMPAAGLVGANATVAVAFGVLLALVGLPAATAAGGGALIGVAHAAAVSAGFGEHGAYPAQSAWMALAIAGGTLSLVGLVRHRRRTDLSTGAVSVAAISAGALHLKLLVLLHPSMPIGDALFHAHRFEWVLSGRYYFTSVAPGLYEFPYAIGFYLLASPLVVFTEGPPDYTALVRVAGTVAQVAAGVAVYAVVVRAWGDRLVGVTTVGAFHLLPLTMGVLGTGNWTNAFAESMALLALAALVTMPIRPLSRDVALGAIALVSLACLSHTSTFAVLPTTLVLAGALYRWRGDAGARDAAVPVIGIAVAAALAAVVIYYGHFGDVYQAQLARIAGEVAAPAAESDPGGRSMLDRLLFVPVLLELYYGAPALVLAGVGGWLLYRRGARDRLTLMIAGTGASAASFLVLGVLTPVSMRYLLAALPAMAVLVGLAVARARAATPPVQAAALVAVTWMAWNAGARWIGWLG